MHPGMGSAGFDERVVFDRFIGGIAPKQKLDNLVTKQQGAKSFDQQAFDQISKEVETLGKRLVQVNQILAGKPIDQPVTFASNIFYGMEMNGRRCEKTYEKLVYPLLQSKVDYLHAEGIASSLFAISRQKNVDQNTLNKLLTAASKKNYVELKYGKIDAYTVNEFSTDEYNPLNAEVNETIKNLFFKDQFVLCDLHTGLNALKNNGALKNKQQNLLADEILASLSRFQGFDSDVLPMYQECGMDKAMN